MKEIPCARCGRRSVADVLLVVGCFGCGANPWEADSTVLERTLAANRKATELAEAKPWMFGGRA